MKCKYSIKTALALILRMKQGESISDISRETGIPKVTLWRWKNGKCLPHEKQYRDFHDWYGKNKEKVIKRLRRKRLDGNWLKALKRDNYRCVVCPNMKSLHVHHIDGNKENNELSNLITLCSACHRAVHRAAKFKKLQFLISIL